MLIMCFTTNCLPNVRMFIMAENISSNVFNLPIIFSQLFSPFGYCEHLCSSLFESLFSIILSIKKVELLIICSMFNFLRNLQTVSHNSISHSHQPCMKFITSLYSCQYLISVPLLILYTYKWV